MNASLQREPDVIAKGSGSSFLVSFRVLDRDQQRAMTAIYAFCRLADDAADDADATRDGAERVAFLRAELERARARTATTPVGHAIAAAIDRYGVDPAHFTAILDGVGVDIAGARFEDMPMLLSYCDKVAGAVGLACLPVFGARDVGSERYAVNLGRALQLTNIARDIHADAQIGRVYLPQAWLRELGIEIPWLMGKGPAAVYARGGAVDRVVQRIVEEARAQFSLARFALSGIARPRVLLPAEIMGAVYADVLVRVARAGGAAVASGVRARVPRWRKLWLAWRTSRRLR